MGNTNGNNNNKNNNNDNDNNKEMENDYSKRVAELKQIKRHWAAIQDDELEIFKVAAQYKIWTYLTFANLKQLSLVSRGVFTIVSHHFNDNNFFSVHNNHVKYYSPKKIRTYELKGHKSNLFYYTNITHLILEYVELPHSPLLSPSITHLIIKNLDSIVQFSLPSSLSHLEYSIPKFSTKEYIEEFISNLPSSLVSLYITGRDITGFSILSLPPKLSILGLPDNYKMDPFKNYLPLSLKTLHYGQVFNGFQEIPVNFPPYLSSLSFSTYFNQEISCQLPSSLTFFSTGKKFNKPLTFLPPSLTHLILGRDFNQPVTSLPLSLSHLKLGRDFDQPIHSLPSSLLDLKLLCSRFNHPLQQLPLSLRSLIVTSYSFNQNISLPPNLSHLELFFQYSRNYYPPFYTYQIEYSKMHSYSPDKVCFSHSIPSFPSSLQTIIFYSNSNFLIPELPPNITKLVLGEAFNHPLPSLPSSLFTIILGRAFNLPLPILPLYLTELAIRNDRYSFSVSIPPYLSILIIGSRVEIPLSRDGYVTIGQDENENK